MAYCGLYCGACNSFKKGKCPGCRQTQKAAWCKIRVCCADHGYATCADCAEFGGEPLLCSKFNNFMSRVIGFAFGVDRAAGIALIRETGPEAFAAQLHAAGKMALPKKRR